MSVAVVTSANDFIANVFKKSRMPLAFRAYDCLWSESVYHLVDAK